MPFYLETLDGRNSYFADLFCKEKNLEDGQIYTAKEIGFKDCLRDSQNAIKADKSRFRAVFYGE